MTTPSAGPGRWGLSERLTTWRAPLVFWLWVAITALILVDTNRAFPYHSLTGAQPSSFRPSTFTISGIGLVDGKRRWALRRHGILPVVADADGAVIVTVLDGAVSDITAVDPTTGSQLWRRRAHEDPMVVGRLVLEMRGAQPITWSATDARSGAPLWSTPPDLAAPALVGGVLLFGWMPRDSGSGPGVVAIDPRDGTELWRRADIEMKFGLPERGSFALVSHRGASTRSLGAVAPRTGELLWERADLSDVGVGVVGDVVTAHDVTGRGSRAIWAATGRDLPASDQLVLGGDSDLASVVGSVAVVTDRTQGAGHVRAVDLSSGRIVWDRAGRCFIDGVVGPTLLASCGSRGGETAIDVSTGVTRWTVAAVYATTTPDATTVLAEGKDTIVAIDVRTGRVPWRVRAETAPGDRAIVGGTAIVTTRG